MDITLYDEKIESINATVESMLAEKAKLQKDKEKSRKNKGIESWLDYTFESSSGPTKEFLMFVKDFKKYLLQQTKNDFELARWSRGHFEIYGHLKSKANGRFIYFSISDVRYWSNAWYNNILIRTAEDEKDFTGGDNNSCSFNAINQKALALIS